MQELLHDKDALTLWLQFMRTQCAEHILRFWLDAESFKASASSRLCSRHTRHSISKKSLNNSVTPSNCDNTESLNKIRLAHDTCNTQGMFPLNGANSMPGTSSSSNNANMNRVNSGIINIKRSNSKETDGTNLNTRTKQCSSISDNNLHISLDSGSCDTGNATPVQSCGAGDVPPIVTDICASSSINCPTTDTGPTTHVKAEVNVQIKLQEERERLQLKLLKSEY